jgi:hypothetical protein
VRSAAAVLDDCRRRPDCTPATIARARAPGKPCLDRQRCRRRTGSSVSLVQVGSPLESGVSPGPAQISLSLRLSPQSGSFHPSQKPTFLLESWSGRSPHARAHIASVSRRAPRHLGRAQPPPPPAHLLRTVSAPRTDLVRHARYGAAAAFKLAPGQHRCRTAPSTAPQSFAGNSIGEGGEKKNGKLNHSELQAAIRRRGGSSARGGHRVHTGLARGGRGLCARVHLCAGRSSAGAFPRASCLPSS